MYEAYDFSDDFNTATTTDLLSIDQLFATASQSIAFIPTTPPPVYQHPLKGICTYPHKKGVPQRVHAFKLTSDILALHNYFLSKSLNTTPHKRIQALRNWLFYTIGINVGWRSSDICSYKWSDILDANGNVIDDLNHTSIESKTSKRRLFVYNTSAKQAIEFYLKATKLTPDPDSYVFPSQRPGKYPHMTYKGFLQILKPAAKACGITYNVGTYSLRKTFGYHYYKNTHDITTLQEIFNHSSPAITLRYIDIRDEEIKEAYEAANSVMPDDLDRYL